MTGEIKDSVALRILKFTPKSKIFLTRVIGLISISLISLFCGYMIHFLFVSEKEGIYSVIMSHFGAFYNDKSFLESIFVTARYTLGDMLLVCCFAFFGYTMLSSSLCRIALAVYSAVLGFCGAFVF